MNSQQTACTCPAQVRAQVGCQCGRNDGLSEYERGFVDGMRYARRRHSGLGQSWCGTLGWNWCGVEPPEGQR